MSVYDKQYYKDNKENYNKNRNKYRDAKLKRIPLDVKLDWYDVLKTYCDTHEKKVNSFLKEACEQVALQNGFTGFVEYHNKPDEDVEDSEDVKK